MIEWQLFSDESPAQSTVLVSDGDSIAVGAVSYDPIMEQQTVAYSPNMEFISTHLADSNLPDALPDRRLGPIVFSTCGNSQE